MADPTPPSVPCGWCRHPAEAHDGMGDCTRLDRRTSTGLCRCRTGYVPVRPVRPEGTCLSCPHSPRTHINGHGMCLAKSCFCLGAIKATAQNANSGQAS